MFLINVISPGPFQLGSAEQLARSSVFINLGNVCNPAVIHPQVDTRSGKHAGTTLNVRDVWSIVSALGLRLKTIPTVFEKGVADSAESSLRAASALHFFAQATPQISSTPCAKRRGFVLPLKQGQRLYSR